MSSRHLIKCMLVALTVLGASLSGGDATAGDDELSADQDNGAEGRNDFGDPGHVAPIKACKDKLKTTKKSLVLRRLPQGPVAADGTLAFQSGVCVYLPPGYARSGLRYPVLYLLHGGGGDQAAWVSLGGIRSMMDELVRSDPRKAMIVVMPDGMGAQWYDSYDRSILNESYVLDYVIPYVDRHFRTIPDRRGRAIAGLSNGGYGALHYAAKAPDLFVAAGSMSGNVGGRSFSGLGTPLFPGGPTLHEAGSYYYGNVPIELAPNLDNVDLVVNWGAACASDLEVDLCSTWGFEQAFRIDNQNLRDRLEAVGHRGGFKYSEDEGGHSWRWWPKWLREKDLPIFFKRLADPQPAGDRIVPSRIPFPFRYRTIAPRSSVYGYDVEVERDASEFLDLVDVVPKGFKIQGSGRVTIRTPGLYHPGRYYAVAVSDARSRAVRADKRGRLRIEVDLGPSHTYEQYSPQGRALQETAGYWATRTVKIG